MGTTTNPFRYSGEYFDEESGLIYLRNRYYSPEIGRFITEDPIQDGLNWYVYCGNNPINFVDPLGLEGQYIPLRDTAEAEGYVVGWDPATSKAYIIGNGQYIEYYAGDGKGSFIQKSDNRMYVWDETYYTDTMLTQADKDAGVTITMVDGIPYKDVSVPLNNSLYNTVKTAEFVKFSGFIAKSAWFVSIVYHEQAWDIKVESSWNATIGTGTFPGTGVKVYYYGWLATPEELGNYTYAFIGHALGYDLLTLCTGSWVAAGMPSDGVNLENEFNDWPAITKGYNAYN